ncbi:hypothetical protein WR25_16712 [Diploscapter pachys]|uniref:PDZ domain-containing protein n=1 Tax=Diploscapter pachys TaxID=2018661 RepID=A0A2A2LTX3_9BILA|nr:hypothetical protein WR25_16712 [Diploscapter pachys]
MEDVASEEEDIVKVISNGNGERKGGGRLESREELNRDELEQEIGELERQLRQERDKNKQFRVDIQEDMEREIRACEDRLMEKLRVAIGERDIARGHIAQLQDAVDTLSIENNRLAKQRFAIEDERNRLRDQLENIQRDYEDTMQERSIVLEENNRMSEERDKLRQAVLTIKAQMDEKAHSNRNSEDLENLQSKLERANRMLQVNTEERMRANAERHELFNELQRLSNECKMLREERDDAQRRVAEANLPREPITDIWSSHTVELPLSTPKPSLGIILAGGRTEEKQSICTPIYVKKVLTNSPLANHLQELDHICFVNDISVAEMDQRSVIEMLKNSHHLKLVIKRRLNTDKIHEIALPTNTELGVELCNGVFINGVREDGVAIKFGLEPGTRLVHVNNTPVYESRQADHLLRTGQLVIGVLDGKKRAETQSKQKSTLFSRIFSRNSADKTRNVVAKANIEGEAAFYRQGSLRIPQSINPQLVRYGSLRASHANNDHAKMNSAFDQYLKKNHTNRSSAHSEVVTASWPHRARPSVFPVFQHPQPIGQSSAYSPPARSSPRPLHSLSHSNDSRLLHSPRPHSVHSHSPSIISQALPHHNQPPPYCPKESSLSSILSSSNSLPHASTSTPHYSHYYVTNSPCGTMMSDCSDIRRVSLSKEGSDFGLAVENAASGGVVITNIQGKTNGVVRRGDRLVEIGGINMRSADKEAANKVVNHFVASHDEITMLVSSSPSTRRIQVPREGVRLCGGNAIGILADSSCGELLEGDLILEIDGYNVRGATLEEAYEALRESLSENAELLIEDGGDRLNRLRLGADGDSFYVRVKIDRNSENKDELPLKAGEIVFIDKTMFMGERGRWRAWKVDREGRQRENGLIPSATLMESQYKAKKQKNRTTPIISGAVYERVERVNSGIKRPVVLLGPLSEVFVQALLDHSSKFARCVAECRDLQLGEVQRQLSTGELIDARRRDLLFDVISLSAVQHIVDQGGHCIVDLSPTGIQRLQFLRIYPIVMRLKFKSAKLIKEIKEEFCGEKISSKQAKELQEKSMYESNIGLEANSQVAVIIVSAQGTVKNIVKSVCQQISAHVDHEQKKTIWVSVQ